MKRDGRENITTIMHDLKNSYAKVFKEPFPVNDKIMEDALISAAREVKAGLDFEWYKDENGGKQIKLTKPVKYVYKPFKNNYRSS